MSGCIRLYEVISFHLMLVQVGHDMSVYSRLNEVMLG
jgi:hypothetical protein